MTRLSHDEYFLRLITDVAARSTCARRAVGAIITDQDHHVLSLGYNGVPRGMPHCTDEPCPGAQDAQGDTRRCLAVHAEINALLQCARLEDAHTLYVSCTPCFTCAKAILNTLIRRIVCETSYGDEGEQLLRAQRVEISVAMS